MKTAYGKSIRETLPELLGNEHTALLVVDVQNDFCSPDGLFAKAGRDLSLLERNLPHMLALVAAAQASDVLTVFIRQTTLPGGLSDSPAWLRLKLRDGKSAEYTIAHSWGWQLVDGLSVRPHDPVIDKYRPDAFHRTALDLILRSNAIETTVLIGCNTEGCVESTARAACHHDYYVVVAEDGVASSLPELHEASLRFLRNRFAVAPAQQIAALWSARGRG
jgi:nicotinamidase-related amidase